STNKGNYIWNGGTISVSTLTVNAGTFDDETNIAMVGGFFRVPNINLAGGRFSVLNPVFGDSIGPGSITLSGGTLVGAGFNEGSEIIIGNGGSGTMTIA